MSLLVATREAVEALNNWIGAFPIERHDLDPRAAQRLLRRLVDQATPRMRRDFLRAVARTVKNIDDPVLIEALRKGNLDAAVSAIPWDTEASEIIRTDFVRAAIDTYTKSGQVSARAIPKRKPFGFSIVDDRPLEWIRAYGADKVSDFGLTSREGLKVALDAMMERGHTPQEAARFIRQHVGLHERFAKAVERRRADLLDAGEKNVDAQVEKYAAELRDLRALNIGRTEGQDAMAGGQDEAWSQAADRELIDPEKAKERWDTAADEIAEDCKECGPMDGQVQPLGGMFTTGTGRQVRSPSVHTCCRCSKTLQPDG